MFQRVAVIPWSLTTAHTAERKPQCSVCLLQSTLPESSSQCQSTLWWCNKQSIYLKLRDKCERANSIGLTQWWQATGQRWTKYSQILMMIPQHQPAIVISLPAHQIMMGQLQDVILCTLIHQQDNIQLPCLLSQSQWVGPWQNTSPSSSIWILTMAGTR